MALFQSLLLLLPAIASTKWVLGGSGESCAQACIGIGLQCSQKGLHERNAETNSEREVAALIASFNETCSSYNLNYGSNGDVPAYQNSTGQCYISDISRQESTFKCDRLSAAGKHRLCWCHAAATSVAAFGCTQDNSGSAWISTSLMIWIISGNMLALGLVCMCCGVLQILLRKWQGKPEEPNLSTRPEDPGIFVRCPACGCPLERSHATNTTTYSRAVSRAASRTHDVDTQKSPKSSPALRQGDVLSEASEHCERHTTVQFSDAVAEVSQSQHLFDVI